MRDRLQLDSETRRARIDARLADTVLAVSVMLVISLVVATDRSGLSPIEGIVCAAIFGSLLLARRRFPVSVLAVTVLLVFGYYLAGFPPIGMVLPAAGALFSAAEAGRTIWAVGSAGALVAVAAFYHLDNSDPHVEVSGYTLITELALAAAAVALGVVVRLVREARERTARIVELTAAEQAHLAEASMHAEKLQIARDLHDAIGHTLSVASLHASVAAEAKDPGTMRSAVSEVRAATSEALRELRRTVKVLRAGPATAPMSNPDLASLGRVFDAARAAGLVVEAEISIPDGALTPPTEVAAYRIIQESVTNVLRHAAASTIRVRATVVDGVLTLTVSDDGQAGDATASAGPSARRRGSGLAGMRERAELLGGSFSADHGPEGFTVTARLPVQIEEEA